MCSSDLQEAAAEAVALPRSYYTELAEEYAARRTKLLGILEDVGFRCYKPSGAYYTMADISAFGFSTDTEFVRHLITEIGVAAVPGSSFFRNPADGHHLVRFTFCKKEETLDEAGRRLRKLKPRR